MAHFQKGPVGGQIVWGTKGFLASTKGAVYTSHTLAAASIPETPLGDLIVNASTGAARTVAFADSGDLVTVTAHGLVVGDAVSFGPITSTTGVVGATVYYVKTAPTANTFTLSATPGGSTLALTTNGSSTYAIKVVESVRTVQPGVALALITSGDDTGKVGPFDAGASDGRQTSTNVVGILATLVPWQLEYRDVDVAALIHGAVTQSKCTQLSEGVFVALTDTVAGYMVAAGATDIIFL
jgi:hypothetical protein